MKNLVTLTIFLMLLSGCTNSFEASLVEEETNKITKTSDVSFSEARNEAMKAALKACNTLGRNMEIKKITQYQSDHLWKIDLSFFCVSE